MYVDIVDATKLTLDVFNELCQSNPEWEQYLVQANFYFDLCQKNFPNLIILRKEKAEKTRYRKTHRASSGLNIIITMNKYYFCNFFVVIYSVLYMLVMHTILENNNISYRKNSA